MSECVFTVLPPAKSTRVVLISWIFDARAGSRLWSNWKAA